MRKKQEDFWEKVKLEKKLMFEWKDGWKMEILQDNLFQVSDATDENYLNLAIVVFHVGTHIDKEED